MIHCAVVPACGCDILKYRILAADFCGLHRSTQMGDTEPIAPLLDGIYGAAVDATRWKTGTGRQGEFVRFILEWTGGLRPTNVRSS